MPHAKTLLTPKELADVIGASESSLRRWVDGGRIRMSRTAGGHRRIPLAEAVRFIRETGATVVRPELLGLDDLPVAGPLVPGMTQDEQLFQALITGDARVARGLILSWYLEGRTLPALFDGPVRAAMHKVGDLWRHDPRGILVEHRATGICAAALDRLGDLLPAVDDRAPLALGGAPQGDPYVLPTRMAGLVVAEAGFRDVNFGANTPVELLADEAVARKARLVWLSVSAVAEERTLRAAVGRLAESLGEHRIDLVIGGVHSPDVVPPGAAGANVIGSMGELAAFARGILSRSKATRPRR
jgi:excisionase family DNA binding protein